MLQTKNSQSYQPYLDLLPVTLNTTPPMPVDPDTMQAPSEPHEVHWLIVTDDKGSREIPLGGEIYSIGRDPNSDIRIFSMFVSRRHATLVRKDRANGSYDYKIVDGDLEGNQSSNGILINGRKLNNHFLKHKDEIVFAGGVSAEYHRVKRDERDTESEDPFDITLIDPHMIDELEEE